MSDQLHNRSSMKDLRRELRQSQTPAESLLWSRLRNRQLEDRKFRRQHSIGGYVVDFYCAEERLIIEVDGSVHDTPEAKRYDAEREFDLCDLGLTLMRFRNEQVLETIDIVLQKITENLTVYLTPDPSPKTGEGSFIRQFRI